MRRTVDRLIHRLARFLLGVFFRRVEVVGAERLPVGAPAVVVANHVNGLVDPVVLLGTVPRPLRFLAKSTLWNIAPLRPLLALAAAIPVYRRQDPGVDTASNEATFARCHELLAAGGTVALFPEGTSHNEPALQPLRTGAARIVLEAEAAHGPLGAVVIPVGLVYEHRERFRSAVLVVVGDPISPTAESALYRHDPTTAVRRLTELIDRGLRAVTSSYRSWEEARLVARAADLFARPGLDVPRGRLLAEAFPLRRAFLEGYDEMRRSHPRETAAVEEAVRRYDELLEAAGLSDAQVASSYPPAPVARFLWRTLVLSALRLPLALVGTALSFLPYQLVGRVVAPLVRHQPDQLATYKLFPALLLYPLFWAGEAAAVATLAGGRVGDPVLVGLAVGLAAPPTGWVALRFHEARRRLQREARAYLVLSWRRRLAAELRQRREEAYRRVEEMASLYLAGRER